jgi:hypothetical protein
MVFPVVQEDSRPRLANLPGDEVFNISLRFEEIQIYIGDYAA